VISFELVSLEIVASKIATIRWKLISIIDVPLVLAARNMSKEYDFNLNVAVAHQAQLFE